MKKKSNKNKFRCVICNMLENEKSDFYIPFFVNNEIVSGKACSICYSGNLHLVAGINTDLYLPKPKRKTKKRTKKSSN